MTNPHDISLHRSLTRMKRALDALISIETRAVTRPRPSKMPLTVEMADKLVPVMTDIYWSPVRNGIDAAPEDEEELRSWLKRQLDKPAVVAALLALLLRFHKRAANMAGSIALELLELSGQFSLTNATYLSLIEDRGTMLTTAGSEMSLIDTTVNDLASAIPVARNADGDTLALLGAYITGRALTRSTGIATYESPWGFSKGFEWTYKGNGVKRMMFDTFGHPCPKICSPLHGTIVPVDNIPEGLGIPQHPDCDCGWTPLTDGWTAPVEIWRGE